MSLNYFLLKKKLICVVYVKVLEIEFVYIVEILVVLGLIFSCFLLI